MNNAERLARPLEAYILDELEALSRYDWYRTNETEYEEWQLDFAELSIVVAQVVKAWNAFVFAADRTGGISYEEQLEGSFKTIRQAQYAIERRLAEMIANDVKWGDDNLTQES